MAAWCSTITTGPGWGRTARRGVVSGGVSYLVSPSVNVGIAARYGSTDVSGATGATDADTWSGAAFTQVDLPANFWFAAMLAYSDVDIDARFNQGGLTARGNTDAESFAGQVVLARPFTLNGGVTLVPNLGASFVDIDRDAFTASPTGGGGGGAGVTRVAGSSSTQVSLTGGLNVLTRFLYEGANGKVITITPSLGMNGFTNLALFDPLIGVTGQDFEDDEFGVSLNTGLEVQFQDGVALGLGATFAGVGSDEQNIQILGGFAIPF